MKFDPEDIADRVYGFIGDACGDLGYDQARYLKEGNDWLVGDDIAKWHKEAEKEGCSDIPGALTDWLYNDIATLQDLMGDRIHDEICVTDGYDYQTNYKQRFNAVLDALSQMNHAALTEACRLMRKEVSK